MGISFNRYTEENIFSTNLPRINFCEGQVLFFATAQVLIVALLNSALEAVVDMTSPGFHELACRAKDMGSVAVFICLVLAGLIWALALVSMLT